MGNQFYIKGNRLYAPNGHYCGVVEQSDDGYHYWWPDNGGNGYLSSQVLKAIADLLDNLNEEWDAIVQKEIGNE
jgi:hypothetical protein